MGADTPGVEGRLYGLNLSSNVPLRSRLAPVRGAIDLSFRVVDSLGEPQSAPAYESPLLDRSGRSALKVYREEEGDLLRLPGTADFLVREREILAVPAKAGIEHMIEIRLIGTVLAYYLERRGVLAIHAAAVSMGGRGVVFLAGKEGGKSTLIAAFLRAGHRLLSDDLLPVDWQGTGPLARPAHPNLRLGPEQIEQFLPGRGDFPLVHPDYPKRLVPVGERGLGRMESESTPVGRIYLLARRPVQELDPEVRITRLGSAESTLELVKNSFVPLLVQGLGWQDRRMGLIGDIVKVTRVYRIEFPSGFERLRQVTDAVSTELEIA